MRFDPEIPKPSLPDFELARLYALERLTRELSSNLYYHSVAHTQDEVVPAAERLAEMEGVTGEDRLLLLTAAWYHDIGYVIRYLDNEVIAVQIAEKILPRFGYNARQIQVVCDTIMVTRLPQTPHNHLEEIMADADLDGLGSDNYFERTQLLRLEMTQLGKPRGDEEWCRYQYHFLSNHSYFTASARALRVAGKERNLKLLAQRIGCVILTKDRL